MRSREKKNLNLEGKQINLSLSLKVSGHSPAHSSVSSLSLVKARYTVNHVVAYLHYVFHPRPEEALAWETVTWVNWLGLEPSPVWIVLPVRPCTQEVLIDLGVKQACP